MNRQIGWSCSGRTRILLAVMIWACARVFAYAQSGTDNAPFAAGWTAYQDGRFKEAGDLWQAASSSVGAETPLYRAETGDKTEQTQPYVMACDGGAL